ncbi:MAG: DUF4266 domain-containing protein [Deltaproteobacteria bacterium]|nr:DUF4266 domain-containing protein [Deltaproteobacteria bacterium]
MKPVLMALLIALAALSVSGCARVKPWEREHLADPIMQFDVNKEERAVREHFLGTREGSAGSFGVSGGGCGCN